MDITVDSYADAPRPSYEPKRTKGQKSLYDLAFFDDGKKVTATEYIFKRIQQENEQRAYIEEMAYIKKLNDKDLLAYMEKRIDEEFVRRL